MKGQRLLVRPRNGDDDGEIAMLLSPEGALPLPRADLWFVAKLVGRVVACAAIDRKDDAAELRLICVERELRGKRIGLLFLRDVERQLASTGVHRLSIRKGVLPESFTRRAGYEPADGSFVKTLEVSPA